MACKQKTARFAAVVAEAGRPRMHLMFVAAAKDPELQAAIKAHRVMSLISFDTGTRKDFGQVGYEEKIASQVLIFPKSLKAFAGLRIVGINYDLLAEEKAAPARKLRKPAAKAELEKAPPVRGRVPNPSPETFPPPATVKQKCPQTAVSKPAAKRKQPIQKKAPKPPRLTLRQQLENVVHEWETGKEVEAKRMLRAAIASIRQRAAPEGFPKSAKRASGGDEDRIPPQ